MINPLTPRIAEVIKKNQDLIISSHRGYGNSPYAHTPNTAVR